MTATQPTPPALLRFAGAILAGVRSDAPDLSQRQLAVLLTAHIEPGPHTVRGLAGHLQVSKPAVTRALDRLEDLGFAARRPDPSDGRSVLVACLPPGARLLRRIADTLAEG